MGVEEKIVEYIDSRINLLIGFASDEDRSETGNLLTLIEITALQETKTKILDIFKEHERGK